MNNPFDEMRAALQQAADIDRAAGQYAERMAEMLNRTGALKRVSCYELKRMKTALRKFDMTTGKWKP